MKRLMFALAIVLSAAPLAAQQSVVEAVKADLVRRNINLQGECGAFAIVQRVAWQLRAQGFGLVAKPSGSNCQGFSTDLVQSATVWVDILSDAGGLNAPQWNAHTDVTPSMWRAPFDPQDVPTTPPVPVPVPVPAPVDLSGVYLKLDALYAQAERIFAADAVADQRHEQELAAVDAKVQKVYDKPSLVEEILKSPYLYTIVGSILAGRYVIPDK